MIVILLEKKTKKEWKSLEKSKQVSYFVSCLTL